eukprot:4277637-Prymnesium_polylepis.1
MCGREACFWAVWGVWDACIQRNVKMTLRDPPSAAARHPEETQSVEQPSAPHVASPTRAHREPTETNTDFLCS